ncbi:MAG: cysteine desulfurase family protein [Planctomycetota bacterium]
MHALYLDHNATTPTLPEVTEVVAEAYSKGHGNPASQHQSGQTARRLLEDARERTASLLGARLTGPDGDQLVFTGTATEANNLALLGIAGRAPDASRHLIISSIEHQSVIEPAEHLLEEGWRLDTLPANGDGTMCAESLRPMFTEQTVLVSAMLGNHETGVLQPVEQLAEACNERGIPMHTDAVQVVGKLPVDFRRLKVSALSFGAHKFGGPVGVAGLLLRHDVRIVPQLFGGHQQRGVRPGTECLPLVLGMLRALEICQERQRQHHRHLAALRDRFESALRAAISGLVVHGTAAPRLPQTSNVAFPDVDGQVMLVALNVAGVHCSAGSACSSGSTELSPTLRAMQMPLEMAARSLRFSFGLTNDLEQIDEAVRRIVLVWSEIAV